MGKSGQKKMKIATVCSGIGSPEQALKELDIPHEIAFACEIDKYARQTYLANFTPNQMYTDLTAEEWDKPEQYSDLFIGGIPCQAFSLAGKRLGELDKRGLLFYDFYRYVKNQQPKVFIIENVKGLLSDNNGITFQNWCALLGRSMNTLINMFNHEDSLLYNLHFKVLNSKDFGVPQNRERVFLVGVRNDLPNTFHFPIGERLTKRLKDILEPEVDEKYYLSDTMLKGFANHAIRHKEKGSGFSFNPKNANEIGNCIRASATPNCPTDNWVSVSDVLDSEPYCVAMRERNPENPSDRTTGSPMEQRLEPNSQGITNTITSVQKDNLIVQLNPITNGRQTYQQDRIYDVNGINPALNTHNNGFITNTLDTAYNQAVVVQDIDWIQGGTQEHQHQRTDGISPTLTSAMGMGGGQTPILKQYHRIRRLTPLECMRLQGYPDSFIKPCSDSQTYKQAGNSITVNVMKAIIKNIIPIL